MESIYYPNILIKEQKRIFKKLSKNKESFYKYLYQELPPLDLVIRTSGEYRLSNFMLYQASYAEFYFSDKYFPDFKEEDFDEALGEYKRRKSARILY